MKEENKIELLKKLISEKEISKELRVRKKPFINKSIPKKNIQELEDYLSENWEIEREFINSKRIKKKKSHDVLFEDKVWSLSVHYS